MRVSGAAHALPARTSVRKWSLLAGRAFRQIPSRARERRFWVIQALVLGATAAHYVAEVEGISSPEGEVHQVAVALLMIPVLYAALSFGWEGTFMTGLWGAVLTSPSILIWHHGWRLWAAELLQLGIIMAIGLVVAWRVALEAQQRLIAERTSANLGILNRVSEALSHTLDVEQRLPGVLSEVRDGMRLRSIAAWLKPEEVGGPPTVTAHGSPGVETDEYLALSRLLDRGVRATLPVGGAILSVLEAETGAVGCLAAWPRPDESIDEEQAELIGTIGHDIAMAIENARLYRQHQEDMETYVRQVTQAQEDERRRMARELHDDTLQEILLLARQLEQVCTAADRDVAKNAENALALARHLSSSVRSFSQSLRPSVLDDLGMVAAIEMVVEDADRVLEGGAEIVIAGRPRSVDPSVGLALFRIAQEALRNVEKHASATNARVEIRFGPGEISLSIEDDGIGFIPPRNMAELARLGKLGVLGIKERAELVGATVDLRSAPGAGTSIKVCVPAAHGDLHDEV